MPSLPHSQQPSPRIALYTRVSSEDQAERQTIVAQQDFLRNFCALMQLEIVAEYADDGVSGTLALPDRPQSRRMLDDAEAGRFDTVLVYRVDRLGRSLKALLSAHDALDRAGVTIRSATEPFDTASPIGTFLFQLLASLAELDRATIIERMVLGRNRVAKAGKWTGGPIPFGYALDADGCLTPSIQQVDGLDDLTEADVARSVFSNIAAGSSTVAEARRLNALGVSTERRYTSGKTVVVADTWGASRVNAMVKNPVYAGRHVLKSRTGPIEREVPALVDPAVWERVQAQLIRNRTLATRNAKTRYLLRGLIRCGDCGAGFTGAPAPGRPGAWYYRCRSQIEPLRPASTPRCRAKFLPVARVEAEVWAQCREIIRNPTAALAEAQAQLRDRLAQSAHGEAERRKLAQALADKDQERERILVLFRRGRILLDEADRQIAEINAEAAALRATLDAYAAQAALADAYETHLAQAGAMLTQLREEVEAIDRTDDWDRKRQIVELLVTRIDVVTTGTGRDKVADLTIHYTLTPSRVVTVPTTNTCSRTASTRHRPPC
jgi:site-specific DNA recombinase